MNRIELANWNVAIIGFVLPLLGGAVASIVARHPVEVRIEASALGDEAKANRKASKGVSMSGLIVIEETAQHRAADKRSAEIRYASAQQASLNPFFYQNGVEQEFEVEQAAVESGADSGAPTMNLGGLIGGRTPLAIIDGRMCRIGDEIERGWILKAVDPVTRSITIQGPAGQTAVVRAER